MRWNNNMSLMIINRILELGTRWGIEWSLIMITFVYHSSMFFSLLILKKLFFPVALENFWWKCAILFYRTFNWNTTLSNITEKVLWIFLEFVMNIALKLFMFFSEWSSMLKKRLKQKCATISAINESENVVQ